MTTLFILKAVQLANARELPVTATAIMNHNRDNRRLEVTREELAYLLYILQHVMYLKVAWGYGIFGKVLGVLFWK